MPGMIEVPEKRQAGRLPVGHRYGRAEVEMAAEISDTKGLHLQNVRWGLQQSDERSWFRAVSHGELITDTMTESPAFGTLVVDDIGDHIHLSRFSPQRRAKEVEPETAELKLEGLDSALPALVADFFSKGGKRSFIKFWRQLKGKEISSTALRAILDAFSEAAGLKEKESQGDAENIPAESFICRARRLDKHGSSVAALDLIYDSVDAQLRKGEFQRLDSDLADVPVDDLSVNILLGILTATLPAKSRLHSRPKLFDEIKRTLIDRGEYEEGLLTGLEG